MDRGSKDSYTDKQKRQAEHIEEGYEKRGVSDEEAERRAWATVNKETGGGKKSGAGRGKPVKRTSSVKGGRKGGAAVAKTRGTAATKTRGTTAKKPRGTAAKKTGATGRGTAARKTATTRKATGTGAKRTARKRTTKEAT